MLPDFPVLKAELGEVFRLFLEQRIDFHLGSLSKIRGISLPEGSGSREITLTGRARDSDWVEAKAEFSIPVAELPTLSLKQILEKIDGVAEQMARRLGEELYAFIGRTVDEAGTSVSAGGKPLTAEMILTVFEKLHIEFDSKGRPQMPSIHLHPRMADAARLALEKLDNDPDLKRRFKTLVGRKYEEWRAREDSRSLVG